MGAFYSSPAGLTVREGAAQPNDKAHRSGLAVPPPPNQVHVEGPKRPLLQWGQLPVLPRGRDGELQRPPAELVQVAEWRLRHPPIRLADAPNDVVRHRVRREVHAPGDSERHQVRAGDSAVVRQFLTAVRGDWA